jgi:serine/threonine-protein kinase SRPK3
VGNVCFTTPNLAQASVTELLRALKQPRTGDARGQRDNPGDYGIPKYLVWPSHVHFTKASITTPINIIDFGQSFTESARPTTLKTPLVLRPPELLFEDEWDYRVDLWTVGCNVNLSCVAASRPQLTFLQIFELITGQPPFDSIMATKETVIAQMVESVGELPLRWKGKI